MPMLAVKGASVLSWTDALPSIFEASLSTARPLHLKAFRIAFRCSAVSSKKSRPSCPADFAAPI